jgi:hypothetical protein
MKRLIPVCLILAVMVSLTFTPATSANVTLVQTDFGSTPGTDVSPFSTDYTLGFTGSPTPGHYQVAKSATGFGPSDWGGLDHTAPGTGCFMVIDGSNNSGDRIVYSTINTVAGYDYTLDGWVQNSLSGGGNPPVLSFRVNGSQVGSTFTPSGAQTWREFTFTYTAVTSGLTTFALNDNNTSSSANDFGIDDLRLSSTIPEPATICLLGLGALSLIVKKK